MRIAIIVPALNTQAPVLVAVTVGGELQLMGHDVTVFYFDDDVNMMPPSGVKFKKIGFFERIDWENYDLVHSHMFRPDAYVFFHKPANSSISTFTTAHNYIYSELRNYYNSLISILFGSLWNIFWLRFDGVCVLTEHARSYYKKVSLNKHVHVCYNGRDLDMDYRLLDGTEAEIACRAFSGKFRYVVGSYCNLIRRKRIDRLVEYIASTDDCGLVVVGSGPEENVLKDLVAELKLQQRVLFLGFQPHAHLFNKFFDVFAMPSEDEGFGLSLIEAALHGQNIVCSDIPVFREIFDESSVTFFDSSKNSLANAIGVALSNPGKSKNAMQKALNSFSVSKMANSYANLFEKSRSDKYHDKRLG